MSSQETFSLRLRLAGPSDAMVVIELVAKLMTELGFSPYDSRGTDSVFPGFVEDGTSGFIMVAEAEGVIAGICGVSAVLALRTRGIYGIVQEVYVLPEYRRAQIGEALLKTSIDHARALGYAMVEVGTPPDGERQGRLYQRSGFRRFGDRYRHTLA